MYPLRLVQSFINALPHAFSEAADQERYVWEVAAAKSAVADDEIRVLSIQPMVFLIGGDWIVHVRKDNDVSVREWQWEADEFATLAVVTDALDLTEFE